MSKRVGLGACAMLAALAVADGAAAQQRGRQQRQEPKKPEITGAILFEQEGVPYLVMNAVMEDVEACIISMTDKTTKTTFRIESNASDRNFVSIQLHSNPLPAPFIKPETRQPLRLEFDDVTQTYTIINDPIKWDGSGWAENAVPRAALRHLQSAVNSRSGMVVTAGDGPPIRFSVPSRAADAFHECGRGILHGRANRLLEQMR